MSLGQLYAASLKYNTYSPVYWAYIIFNLIYRVILELCILMFFQKISVLKINQQLINWACHTIRNNTARYFLMVLICYNLAYSAALLISTLGTVFPRIVLRSTINFVNKIFWKTVITIRGCSTICKCSTKFSTHIR